MSSVVSLTDTSVSGRVNVDILLRFEKMGEGARRLTMR